uniref:Uncharacterized protein n=1 Tax=Panagrolaimus superbus TaxID=310955 RepID=A0A914YYW4_9BILA
MKLKPDELLFISQVFNDFIKSKYPVPDFYRQRLKEYDPIIVKFARCRSFKSARKLSHHVPLNVFASICRWGSKFYNEEEEAATKVMKKKSKSKPKPNQPTHNITENEDVKPSRSEILLSLPPELDSTQQTTQQQLIPNIKQEETSSFTIGNEV